MMAIWSTKTTAFVFDKSWVIYQKTHVSYDSLDDVFLPCPLLNFTIFLSTFCPFRLHWLPVSGPYLLNSLFSPFSWSIIIYIFQPNIQTCTIFQVFAAFGIVLAMSPTHFHWIPMGQWPQEPLWSTRCARVTSQKLKVGFREHTQARKREIDPLRKSHASLFSYKTTLSWDFLYSNQSNKRFCQLSSRFWRPPKLYKSDKITGQICQIS